MDKGAEVQVDALLLLLLHHLTMQTGLVVFRGPDHLRDNTAKLAHAAQPGAGPAKNSAKQQWQIRTSGTGEKSTSNTYRHRFERVRMRRRLLARVTQVELAALLALPTVALQDVLVTTVTRVDERRRSGVVDVVQDHGARVLRATNAVELVVVTLHKPNQHAQMHVN